MNDYLTNSNYKDSNRKYNEIMGENEEGEVVLNNNCNDNNNVYGVDRLIKYSSNGNYTEPNDDNDDDNDDNDDDDDDDDQQYSHNMNSKSNRRKQSNPIRISMRDKLKNAIKNDQTCPSSDNQMSHESAANVSDFTGNKLTIDESQHLKRKPNQCDPMANGDHDDDDSSLSQRCPSKRFKSDNDSESKSLPVVDDQAKFFQNMDSFCTICKKEVCNKYFLRTHLANKHGIYLTDDLTTTSYLSTVEQHLASSQATMNDNDMTMMMMMSKTSPNEITTSQDLYSQQQQRINDDYCDLCQKQFCNKYYLKKHKSDVHGVQADSTLTQTPSLTTGFTTRTRKGLDCNTNTMSSSSSSSLSSTPSPPNNNSQQMHGNNKSLMDSLQSSTNPNLSTLMLMNPFINSMMHPLLAAAATQEAVAAAVAAASFMQQQQNTDGSIVTDEFELNKPVLNAVLPLIKTDSGNKLYTTDNNHMDLGMGNASDSTPTGPQVKCNLCSKVFYNEDYLKLHKLNKHGIKPLGTVTDKPDCGQSYTQQLSKSSRAYTPQVVKAVEQTANNKENDLYVFNNQQMATEQKTTTALTNSTTRNMNKYDVYNETYCEYCNKKFCNKYFLKTHMLKTHGKDVVLNSSTVHNEANSERTSDSNQVDDHCVDSNEATDCPSELSGLGNSGDRVQCDICQKQVCNKYFLRTHKQKVHGVYDTGSTNDKSFDVHNKQEPLDSGYNDENLVGRSPASTPITRDSYCDLCKRQFCSKYFLRNHMINMHGIQSTTTPSLVTPQQQAFGETHLLNVSKKAKINEIYENQKCQASSIASSSSSSSSKSSAQSPNTLALSNSSIHDRSMSPSAISSSLLTNKPSCLLCKKTLCNKYFLKSHLINVHKMTFDEYQDKYLTVSKQVTEPSGHADHKTTKKTRLFTKNSSYLNLRKKFIRSLNRPKLKLQFRMPKTTMGNNKIENTEIEQQQQLNKIANSKPNNDVKMQKFLLDSNDDAFLNNFMPCMVYLPMRNWKKITKPLSINLTLMPMDPNKNTTTNDLNTHNNLMITNGFLDYEGEDC